MKSQNQIQGLLQPKYKLKIGNPVCFWAELKQKAKLTAKEEHWKRNQT